MTTDELYTALLDAGMDTEGTKLTRNGTNGRVYGGDKGLVHIPDGQRRKAGEDIAMLTDDVIRDYAALGGAEHVDEKLLCPGCYMIALFNAAVELAKRNGQPLSELGNTLGKAFLKLAENPDAGVTEEIEVIVDPC